MSALGAVGLSSSAVTIAGMAGGFYGERGRGVPIGVRAGMSPEDLQLPWEQPQAVQVPPHHRHVAAFIRDEWVPALAVSQRREPDGWHVLVAYALEGAVSESWLPARLVQLVN